MELELELELELQKFLRNGGTRNQLNTQYAIQGKIHGKYPNLVLFKYSQIYSPMSEKIVQESRGIILDKENNWNIVSRSYDKFFNYGESNAPTMNWANTICQAKEDGSICTIYYYDNQWNVCSNGSPDASGMVGDYNITFANLFWNVWNELNYILPDKTYKDYCFMFELCTLMNKVVVPHKQNRLVLHGVRNKIEGFELNPKSFTEKFNWECIKEYPLSSLEEIIAASEALSGVEAEGFVCVDYFGQKRIKCKSPMYVSLSHLRSGFGPRRLLEIIVRNESEEFLAYFEEFRSMHEEMKAKYDNEIEKINEYWEQYKGIENQKEFAMIVKDLPFSGILFNLRSGKIQSIREGLMNMNIKNLMEKLKIQDNELEPERIISEESE